MTTVLLFINILALIAFGLLAPWAALTLVLAVWDFYKTETDSRYRARKYLVEYSRGYHTYFPWASRCVMAAIPGIWLLAVWLSGVPLFG